MKISMARYGSYGTVQKIRNSTSNNNISSKISTYVNSKITNI